jgi:hypothetical protein
MRFLASTFSPAMLGPGAREAIVLEIELNDVPAVSTMSSIVSHNVTAAILSGLLEEPVEFRRINVSLEPGDWVYCIIPKFRASKAREFTRQEVEQAGFRVFLVEIK